MASRSELTALRVPGRLASDQMGCGRASVGTFSWSFQRVDGCIGKLDTRMYRALALCASGAAGGKRWRRRASPDAQGEDPTPIRGLFANIRGYFKKF
jgi:hypothetical protein